ncbi:MAG: M48 family metalloprotease, partial [Alphaproteobacteria bacterium]
MTNFVKKLCWVFLMLATFTPALADEDGKGPQFIRDAEIENYLRDLAAPIYRAADINPDSISIAIVRSNAINAFVAGGMNEFFYTGLLQLADTPEQLAGVIAHETGHISGGHLVRGQEEMRNASTQAILGMLLSVAAGAVSGNGQAAAGAISGTQHLVQRSVLGFTRSQESSA